jgi:hypothetical protein
MKYDAKSYYNSCGVEDEDNFEGMGIVLRRRRT